RGGARRFARLLRRRRRRRTRLARGARGGGAAERSRRWDARLRGAERRGDPCLAPHGPPDEPPGRTRFPPVRRRRELRGLGRRRETASLERGLSVRKLGCRVLMAGAAVGLPAVVRTGRRLQTAVPERLGRDAAATCRVQRLGAASLPGLPLLWAAIARRTRGAVRLDCPGLEL